MSHTWTSVYVSEIPVITIYGRTSSDRKQHKKIATLLSSVLQDICTPAKKTAKITISTVAHKYHGKTFFLTAKLSFSRQNFLFHGKTLSHGKTFFYTAKLSFHGKTLSHGKTFFYMAKLSFHGKTLSHGKTFFFTAKLSFSRPHLFTPHDYT